MYTVENRVKLAMRILGELEQASQLNDATRVARYGEEGVPRLFARMRVTLMDILDEEGRIKK